jgi:hypothetical protein
MNEEGFTSNNIFDLPCGVLFPLLEVLNYLQKNPPAYDENGILLISRAKTY